MSKLLILHRPGSMVGGDLRSAAYYENGLIEKGHDATLWPADVERDDYRDFDAVILWSIRDPRWALPAAWRVKQQRGRLAIVPTWDGTARRRLSTYMDNPDELGPEYTINIAKTLRLADVLFVSTMYEARECWALVPQKPVLLIGRGQPELDEVEIGDPLPYVCSLARIEPNKNQLNVALACSRLGIEFACVGPISNPDYAEQVRQAGANMVGEMGHRESLEILAHARAHVMPSFTEMIGNSNLEAAALGVPAVMGTTTEPEWFGPWGVYADPESIDQITDGILDAWFRPRGARLIFHSWDSIAARTVRWLEGNP